MGARSWGRARVSFEGMEACTFGFSGTFRIGPILLDASTSSPAQQQALPVHLSPSPPSRPPHLTLWGDKWGQAGVHSANTEVRADPGRRISIVISYFHGGFHWAPPTLSIRGPGPSWGPGGLPCGMWPRPGVMWPDAATANWTFYLNINSAVAFRSLTWLIYFSIKACS